MTGCLGVRVASQQIEGCSSFAARIKWISLRFVAIRQAMDGWMASCSDRRNRAENQFESQSFSVITRRWPPPGKFGSILLPQRSNANTHLIQSWPTRQNCNCNFRADCILVCGKGGGKKNLCHHSNNVWKAARGKKVPVMHSAYMYVCTAHVQSYRFGGS